MMDLSMLLEELGLTTRAYNLLKRNKVNTLKELLRHSQESILDMRSCGVGTLADIEKALASHGLALATDEERMESVWLNKIIEPITVMGEDRMGVPVTLYLHSDGTLHRKAEGDG